MKLSGIKQNPTNPRIIKDDKFQKLVTSIKEFPEMLEARPIVVNPGGIIIGGNMRYKACKAAGLTEAPVYVATWEESKAKEFIVKDNVGFGEWDWDILANEWDAAELDEWGLDVWQPEEEEKEGLTDPDEVPEAPEEAQTKLGDLYILGEHRLLCGDSTKAEDVEKLMNGEKADMVFTDPPYGMKYTPNHNKERENNKKGITYKNVRHQEMIIGDDKDFDPSFLIEYFSYCKEQFWWGADYYIDKIVDFYKGNFIVWNKRFGIEDMNWSSSHFELCWSKQSHLKEVINVKWFGVQGTEKQDVRTRIHPTQKPIELIGHFLNKYSKENDLIADLFLGSGSTLIVAEKTGRKCYGMELDPKYCDVIVKRWEDFTGKKASKQ